MTLNLTLKLSLTSRLAQAVLLSWGYKILVCQLLGPFSTYQINCVESLKFSTQHKCGFPLLSRCLRSASLKHQTKPLVVCLEKVKLLLREKKEKLNKTCLIHSIVWEILHQTSQWDKKNPQQVLKYVQCEHFWRITEELDNSFMYSHYT